MRKSSLIVLGIFILISTVSARQINIYHYEKNFSKYRLIINKYCSEYNIDTLILHGLICWENTEWNADTVSATNDVGLCQIHSYSTKQTAWLKIPENNIFFATRKLRDLLERYNDDLLAALSAYNLGNAGYRRFMKSTGNKYCAYAYGVFKFYDKLAYREATNKLIELSKKRIKFGG